MMKINNNIFKYVSTIKKIIYNKNNIIIYDDKEKYLYLDYYIKNDLDINIKCLRRINLEDDFSLFLLSDLEYYNIDTIIDLYNNSVVNKEFDNDKKKIIYDKLIDKLNDIYFYYYGLQEVVERQLILYDFHKYFLINFSLIYDLLDIGYYFLKLWFDGYSKNKEVLCLSLINDDNFYNGYIINTDYCYRDNYIEEISNYFKNHYLNKDIYEEINYFFKEFNVEMNDKYLLFCYLVIIPKIDFNNKIDVYSLIKYVNNTYLFLKNNKEYENVHDDKF